MEPTTELRPVPRFRKNSPIRPIAWLYGVTKDCLIHLHVMKFSPHSPECERTFSTLEYFSGTRRVFLQKYFWKPHFFIQFSFNSLRSFLSS